MGNPTLPSLPGFAAHFGVQLSFIGDDGDWIVALGHHEPRRVVAALNRHVRHDLGWSSLSDEWDDPTYPDVVRLTRQTWCVLAEGCADHRDGPDAECAFCRDVQQAEWWLDWHGITEDTPGAFPITVVER